MLTRRNGGFVEFIPSPQEKREAVLRDHALDLFQNLHLRVEMIEHCLGLHPCLADEFHAVLRKIAREEADAKRAHDAAQADA